MLVLLCSVWRKQDYCLCIKSEKLQLRLNSWDASFEGDIRRSLTSVAGLWPSHWRGSFQCRREMSRGQNQRILPDFAFPRNQCDRAKLIINVFYDPIKKITHRISLSKSVAWSDTWWREVTRDGLLRSSEAASLNDANPWNETQLMLLFWIKTETASIDQVK